MGKFNSELQLEVNIIRIMHVHILACPKDLLHLNFAVVIFQCVIVFQDFVFIMIHVYLMSQSWNNVANNICISYLQY